MTIREITSEGKCPYFEGKESLTTFRHTPSPTSAYTSHHMAMGWRRFGGTTFRPICPWCDKCESLRIVVTERPFSKREKRILKQNHDLRVEITSPQATQAHLDLYHEFHAFRHDNRKWDLPSMTMSEYEDQFSSFSGEFGLEARYYEGDTLICVDLFDVGDDGISSIYCYWKPTHARRSLGTFSLLYQIVLAQRLNLPYIYLGYAMSESDSLRYKYTFSPLERLIHRPKDDEYPLWRRL